jgi:hypothetical protein
MENVKLETINLDVNGTKLSMTLEQAKALNKLLNELFSDVTHPIYVPYYYPTYPAMIQPWDKWVVTCESNTVTLKA